MFQHFIIYLFLVIFTISPLQIHGASLFEKQERPEKVGLL
jgi:hypothetical protein